MPDYEVDYIQSTIYESKRPYEYEMLQVIKKGLSDNDLFVDVGANIGNHSLYLASVAGCKVVAFEPNKRLYEPFCKSVELNSLNDRVKVFNIGLGQAVSKAKLINLDDRNLGAQSLQISETGKCDISVYPLDQISFDARITVLKIDVEGMEFEVLMGAKSKILTDKPLLIVEAADTNAFDKIRGFVEECNYVYCHSFNGTPTHFFIHQDEIKDSPWKFLFFDNAKSFYQMRHYHKKLKKAVNVLRQLKVKGW
ncbi:FkbM family methyltransferase [Nitrincola nitratireducens]|nr:FkbM family methyltransferase [Nitrincola nitratireducens]